MAHADCIGTWKDVKLGGNPDGNFKIEDDGAGGLKGTYIPDGSPLKDLKCDGKTMSFHRVDATDKIEYIDGKITKSPSKFELKGKFKKTPKKTNKKSKMPGNKLPPPGPDDWTAEKPVA